MTIDAVEEASEYTFRNADPQGSRQLTLLADILDEHTIKVLASIGTGIGWRCLDIGPGAGTVTRWIAGQVGPTGRVTALDLDPRHIDTAAGNVTVLQGDVRTVDLPPHGYDLIHARLVLLHLTERALVLDRLAGALKPGGLLVVSDWDCTDRNWLLHAGSAEAAAAYDAFQDAILSILTEHGADLGWARTVPLAMRAAGLVDVSTVVHNRLWAGGTAGNLLHVSNSYQLQDELLGRGMTVEQLDLLREAMQDPRTLAYSYWMFTTVGRRARP
ncbi:class I SAM-dependent methyltransferase [Dactylosporangium sp. AC04546]|uniref:class I SAM-dependent methyltransferase n=1 Tax=Dactylosporangium sp. AC04546 TaxID=2862460 RepID=UPI001EDEDBC9|nr:class I SAM-dependent methyltransferase [Dactylosporangium sp. AC04546]WVK79236.1 class I SAM-dependent methyltransferase [Dactylosporangium sp. AC04546]